MEALEDLERQLNDKTNDLKEVIDSFRDDFLAKLQSEKDNKILTAIQALTNRLDRIEAKIDNETV